LSRLRAGAFVLCLASLPLTSCVSAGHQGTATADEIFPSRYLEAILRAPAGYDSSRTYPLLVALHGNGGTAFGLAPRLASLAAASFFVAVPQGEYPGAGGGYSWFEATTDRRDWELSDAHVVATVVALVEALRSHYRIGKVFVLGFSQGASLAYLTALRNPSLVAGVVAISGGLPPIDTAGAIVHAQDVAAARSVRVFVARGTEDPYVSRRAFLGQRDFFASRGYAVTAFEFPGGHEVPDAVMSRVRAWLREAVQE
jgi:phospholipase/carboxylesterase